MIDKKQMLLDVKDFIIWLPVDDIQEIFNDAISYKVTENYCQFKFKNNVALAIRSYIATWHKNNKYHRGNDKPAVISLRGYKAWYENGLRHRDNNKPAEILINGEKLYFVNGEKVK